jgi:hypothetical protein
MKTDVIKEAAAFVLQGSSYNGTGETVEVSYAELRAAEVGTSWEAYDDNNCGRALNEESAEVVYKTGRGCAVLFRSCGTTDDPNPEDWEDTPELVWYEFA